MTNKLFYALFEKLTSQEHQIRFVRDGLDF